MPYGLSEDDIGQVWLSIALHTTPGVPKHLRPSVSLVTAGAEMDVLAMDYAAFSSVQREAVVHAHPRGEGFKECVIGAFADGLRHRPQMTFGNVKTDVLVDQEPGFKPLNFVEVIRQSPWTAWNKMWERACSRMRWVRQHFSRLTRPLREQARSPISIWVALEKTTNPIGLTPLPAQARDASPAASTNRPHFLR